jgi:hypothetical protein
MDGETTNVFGRSSENMIASDARETPENEGDAIVLLRGESERACRLLSDFGAVVVIAGEEIGGATIDFGSFQLPRRGDAVDEVGIDRESPEDDDGNIPAAIAEMGGGDMS